MSDGWGGRLVEPLATVVRNETWARLEPARQGGWLLLRSTEGDPATQWYHLADGETRPRQLRLDKERKIPGLREALRRWQEADHDIRLLRWRPGRRAVFRVRADGVDRACKLFRRADAVALRWGSFAVDPQGWNPPPDWRWDADLLLLSVDWCPGEGVYERWQAGRGRGEDGDRIAALLDRLRGTPVPEGLPGHDVEAEVRVLEKRLRVVGQVLPGRAADEAADLAERVYAALRGQRSPGDVVCHRDLYDKQLLFDGPRSYLIDLDLMAAGSPGLDPGNFLAHLWLRARQGVDLPWRGIAGRILARTPATVRELLPAWIASTLLRLSLVYALRADQVELVRVLKESAGAALDRRGPWGFLDGDDPENPDRQVSNRKPPPPSV